MSISIEISELPLCINICIKLWFYVKVMPVFPKLEESEILLGKGIQPIVLCNTVIKGLHILTVISLC